MNQRPNTAKDENTKVIYPYNKLTFNSKVKEKDLCFVLNNKTKVNPLKKIKYFSSEISISLVSFSGNILYINDIDKENKEAFKLSSFKLNLTKDNSFRIISDISNACKMYKYRKTVAYIDFLTLSLSKINDVFAFLYKNLMKQCLFMTSNEMLNLKINSVSYWLIIDKCIFTLKEKEPDLTEDKDNRLTLLDIIKFHPPKNEISKNNRLSNNEIRLVNVDTILMNNLKKELLTDNYSYLCVFSKNLLESNILFDLNKIQVDILEILYRDIIIESCIFKENNDYVKLLNIIENIKSDLKLLESFKDINYVVFNVSVQTYKPVDYSAINNYMNQIYKNTIYMHQYDNIRVNNQSEIKDIRLKISFDFKAKIEKNSTKFNKNQKSLFSNHPQIRYYDLSTKEIQPKVLVSLIFVKLRKLKKIILSKNIIVKIGEFTQYYKYK